MALCLEFGEPIGDAACDTPMVAGPTACFCARCGLACRGLFEGCATVWQQGVNGAAITPSLGITGAVEGATCVRCAPGGDLAPSDDEAVVAVLDPVPSPSATGPAVEVEVRPAARREIEVDGIEVRMREIARSQLGTELAITELTEEVARLRSDLELVAARIAQLLGGPSLVELMDRLDEVADLVQTVRRREPLRAVRSAPDAQPPTD